MNTRKLAENILLEGTILRRVSEAEDGKQTVLTLLSQLKDLARLTTHDLEFLEKDVTAGHVNPSDHVIGNLKTAHAAIRGVRNDIYKAGR